MQGDVWSIYTRMLCNLGSRNIRETQKKYEKEIILLARKPAAPVTRIDLFSKNSRTLPSSIIYIAGERERENYIYRVVYTM